MLMVLKNLSYRAGRMLLGKAGLMLVSLSLVACGGSGDYGPARAFALNTADGDQRTLSSYGVGDEEQIGTHHLLVNFWASWCRPCIEEIPLLQQLAEDRDDEVRVVGIAADRIEPARAFAERLAIEYAVLFGDYAEVETLMRDYGNSRAMLPYSVLISPAGRIVWRHTGLLSRQDLQDLPL